MRYQDLKESSDLSSISHLFNGTTRRDVVVEIQAIGEPELKNPNLLWHISSNPASPDADLAIAFDTQSLTVFAMLVYLDDGEVAEVEQFFGMAAITSNLRRFKSTQLADALDAVGAKSTMDEAQYTSVRRVSEAYGNGRNSWAILPATMALYNKRVVDIVTAASCWAPGPETILVCSKEERTGKKRLLFVASSGESYDYYAKDIGKSFETYHDQTGASKGMYQIENVVVVQDSAVVRSANTIGLKEKCSVSVFK